MGGSQRIPPHALAFLALVPFGLLLGFLYTALGGMCVLPKRGVRDAGGTERLRGLAGRHVTSGRPSS
jgi:hypothetical protein